MKLKCFFIAVLTLIVFNSFSQTPRGPIRIKTGAKGTFYFIGSTLLEKKEVSTLLESNEEASKLFKSANLNFKISTACLMTAVASFTIQTVLPDDKKYPQAPLTAMTVGFLAAAIPFHVRFIHRAEKAIDVYNNSFRTGVINHQYEFGLCYTSAGIGLGLRF
ncbi:MAG: hypothetical protein RL204_2341 [Bacteroidota bacterium]|jgi:hypothetical protein